MFLITQGQCRCWLTSLGPTLGLLTEISGWRDFLQQALHLSVLESLSLYQLPSLNFCCTVYPEVESCGNTPLPIELSCLCSQFWLFHTVIAGSLIWGLHFPLWGPSQDPLPREMVWILRIQIPIVESICEQIYMRRASCVKVSFRSREGQFGFQLWFTKWIKSSQFVLNIHLVQKLLYSTGSCDKDCLLGNS